MKTSPASSLSRRDFVRNSGLAAAARAADAPAANSPALLRTQHCHLVGVVTGDPAGQGKQWAQQYGFTSGTLR